MSHTTSDRLLEAVARLQAELALLVQEREAAEAAYLTPATQRLRQQREALETRNRTLEILAFRKETLVRRLRDFMTETQAERRAIESELAAVLADGQKPETDRWPMRPDVCIRGTAP